MARPDAEHEHPGRHRVERAGVPDLAGRAQPAGPGHDVVAGPARRFVDDEDAVGRGLGARRRQASAPVVLVLVLAVLLVRVGLTGVHGTGRGGGHGGVALAGLAQEVLEVGRGLRDRVGDELQARREPDAELLADERAQLALVELEEARGLGALTGIPEDRVEERGVLEVAGDPDVGDGDEPEVGVLDDRLQVLGGQRLDAVGDLLGACGVSHGVLLTSVGSGGAIHPSERLVAVTGADGTPSL